MNNFVFENSSKVYFGKGCVKEYLSNILTAYVDTVMLCYGGGETASQAVAKRPDLFTAYLQVSSQ